MNKKDFEIKFGSLPAKVGDCVHKVMQKGYDESSAVAICRSAIGMTSEPESGGVTQDIHGRGERSGSKQEVFDIPTTQTNGGIHTPQFVKVKKAEFEMDPLWKQTKDLMGVEIFEAGTWKGREFTESDLQMAVQNFREGILGAEPYITIDHSSAATSEFKNALDGMALGFVKNLYKVGKKLLADFTKVPKVIAELIMAGPLKNKSIELWPEFEAADGTIYKNVLEAVTFTGKIPAVAGLSDVVALFKRETGINQKANRVKLKLTTGGKTMDERTIELPQSEYTGLLKFKALSEAADDQIKTLKFKHDEIVKQNEGLEKKIVELEKFKADTAKASEVREHNEAVAFSDGLIKKGTILPASKDLYIDQYKMYKGKGPEMFKAYTDEIESRKATIITGEMDLSGGQAGGKPPLTFFTNQVKMLFKKGGSKMYDDAEKVVKTYMEKYGVDHATAMKHLGLLKDAMEAEADGRKKMEAEEDKIKAAYEASEAEKSEEADEEDGTDDKDEDEKPEGKEPPAKK